MKKFWKVSANAVLAAVIGLLAGMWNRNGKRKYRATQHLYKEPVPNSSLKRRQDGFSLVINPNMYGFRSL